MIPEAGLLDRLLREAIAAEAEAAGGGSLAGATLHWRVTGGALGISACYAAMRRVIGAELPPSVVIGGSEAVTLTIRRDGRGL